MNHGWDFSGLKNESNSFSPDPDDVELNFDQRSHNSYYYTEHEDIDNHDSLIQTHTSNGRNRLSFSRPRNTSRKFRQIPLEQVIIGCNNNGTPNTRFIVPEEDNPNFVKEYTKTHEKYDCLRCRVNKRRIQGKIINNIFYAPEFHLQSCFPISRVEAEKRLQNNKRKETKRQFIEKYSNLTKLPQNRQIIESEPNPSEAEIITIDDDDDDETFINHQNFEQECAITDPDYNYVETNDIKMEAEVSQMPEEIQFDMDEKTFILWQRIKAQNEYLATIIQLNETSKSVNSEDSEFQLLSTSTVPSEHDETLSQSSCSRNQYFYDFNYPSTFWLKNACKKLKLAFNQNAYQFWANNINITHITENSKSKQVQTLNIGKHSGFRALSFLISGQENPKIKNVIYKYFLENYKTLGLFGGIDFSSLIQESEIIKQTIYGEYLTPELWEIIAKMLECNVGIFIEDKFVKYGNWNNTLNESSDKNDEIITLLFQIIDENYCIVTNLINNV